MKVEVKLLLDLNATTVANLQARLRLDSPERVQVHTRDMPPQHLGDGLLVSVHTGEHDVTGGGL